MNKVFIAPGRYVQGRNALNEAGVLVGALGKRVMTLWDAQVKGIVGETLLASLQGAGLSVEDVLFNGDSTKAEAARVAQLIHERKVDVIMGVGGGKTLDTAKAAAAATGVKVVTCPTVASNDSPTSSFTVWYDEQGNCIGFESWGTNPDLVLVDTQVIAQAPVRTFVAGFGIITQLCLDDDMPVERIYRIVDFEIAIGLPVTFADLGLPGVTRERLARIGAICAGSGSLCENHPFPVTADDIVNAMIAADALGEERKRLLKQ